ncbi:hypothetical protein EIP91_008959 [Steccherinum ochraceum]|uniref:Uncharacterized protein n=1 Tax=Steccherinum ochraceum TaxID=92696 RepID=A0A4R0RKN8_9APHY|nr:hypothetical protein EIP91_008959 [Steccherinum ochraceum]
MQSMQSTLDLSQSTSTSRVTRPEPPQPSSSRVTRSQDAIANANANANVNANANAVANGDRSRQAAPKQPRSYKDKFNLLKEKYDQVTAARDRYNKELAVAQDKIKKLENECNLLLDAVDIAAPSQPTILHYLTQDPIPEHYHITSRGPLPPPMQPPEPEPQSQPSRSNGTNGHYDHGGRVNASVW